jgi:hypothetical protein
MVIAVSSAARQQKAPLVSSVTHSGENGHTNVRLRYTKSGLAMPKKDPSPVSLRTPTHKTVLEWHHGPGEEFYVYAGAFHTAAKALVASPDLDRIARTVWDACPVIFLYRRAFELYLKAIVLGHETNVLKSKPEPASSYRTYSLRRLARIVCEIVKELGGEESFISEGVAKFSDFRAIISEIDTIDLESYALRYPLNLDENGISSWTSELQLPGLCKTDGRRARLVGCDRRRNGGDLGSLKRGGCS